MSIIKEADFRKEIKSAPKTVYLFAGDEDYMKSFALKCAKDAISPDPSFSFFNEIKLDSLSYSPEALLEAMMPLPMMADRKLIIISGLNINAMKPKEIDELFSTLEQLEEYDYNTVIFNVASDCFDVGDLPKRPSSMIKNFSEHMSVVVFEKNSPSKLAGWVAKHYEHNGVTADSKVCALTVEICGRDMFNLSSETDKISFFVRSQGRNAVTVEDVRNIAIPAAEYDTFAFANAIGARKKEEALNILRDFKTRKTDPIIIMAEMTRIVCDMASVAMLSADGLTAGEISDALKMHEYRISIMLNNAPSYETCKIMLEKCREADLEIKSFSRDGYAALEKLICTI
jgi:DNA polymerase-3 subunit delta